MQKAPLSLFVIVLAACQQAPEQQEAATPAPAGPAPGTPEWKIESALGAAPAAISANAAVMDWPAAEGGSMAELRPGTNGWTCMPDVPSSPGTDPMCLDSVALQWAAAWQAHTTPTIAAVGFAYMLQGGSDASNTDPFATGPQPGEQWVETGPHVMLFLPDPKALASVSTDYRAGGPYIMWQGTPYAHVMLPVR